MSQVTKFKILPKHMLVSNRDFPLGNAFSNDFEFWHQERSSAKDTINQEQIKCYEWLRITCHAITTVGIQSSRLTKRYA